ncbi:MAG: DUF21 domain-containing protein [Chlamydiia bacterium]|nr:DUF21 domain-containing protein [Chlamydiia bacterium]
MQIGSEASRRLYTSLGINPDLAPFTQVILVLILAELVPIFVARRHSEALALWGTPIIYFSAKVLRLLIAVFQYIVQILDRLMGAPSHTPAFFLSREELQGIVEAFDLEADSQIASDTVSTLSRNLFRLRAKNVQAVLLPLTHFPLFPAHSTITQIRQHLPDTSSAHILLYDGRHDNIVGTINLRALIHADPEESVRKYASLPRFLSDQSPLIEVLDGFRSNNQSLEVVLDLQGRALGIVTLEAIIEELFGKIPSISREKEEGKPPTLRPTEMVVDRSFSGDTTVGQLNQQLHVLLPCDETLTLSDLLRSRLGPHPDKGESILIAPFEISVAEVSLLSIETVKVKTLAPYSATSLPNIEH